MEENQNTKTDSSYGKPTLSGLSQTVLNTPLPSPQQLPGYQLLLSASPSLSQLLYSGRPQATQTPITQSQQPITLGSLLNSAATSASSICNLVILYVFLLVNRNNYFYALRPVRPLFMAHRARKYTDSTTHARNGRAVSFADNITVACGFQPSK